MIRCLIVTLAAGQSIFFDFFQEFHKNVNKKTKVGIFKMLKVEHFEKYNSKINEIPKNDDIFMKFLGRTFFLYCCY